MENQRKSTIKIPKYVKEIVKLLQDNNFEAYLVGGCVRDHIIGIEPNDWDICTNAIPNQITELFENNDFNVIKTGEKHGTLTVGKRHNNEYCEVTTYRIDGEYLDNRRPDNVTFTSKIEEDLLRRDFTINAIAYDPFKRKYIDPYNGRKDIENKIIKCVGKPRERFQEDALRIMRALRFAFKYEFLIDMETGGAMMGCVHLLDNISTERKRDEFFKCLIYGKNVLYVLKNHDMIKYLIPELRETFGFEQHNPWHCYDIYNHTNAVVNAVHENEEFSNDIILLLAAVLHDIGKPRCFTYDHNGIGHFYGHPEESRNMCGYILNRLRVDNETKRKVIELVKLHDKEINPTPHGLRSLIFKVANDKQQARRLLVLQLCDKKGQNISVHKPVKEAYDRILKCQEILEEIINQNDPVSIKDLAVNGHDMMNIGFKNSEIGKELSRLLQLILINPELNEKEKLLELAKKDFSKIN